MSEITYSESTTGVLPDDVPADGPLTVECYGAGADGGVTSPGKGAAGGGGGAYSKTTVTGGLIYPGQGFQALVGDQTILSGETRFDLGGGPVCLAKGGTLGTEQTHGFGGDGEQGIGDVKYHGGNGGDAINGGGGAGGGASASSTGDGGNGQSNSGSTGGLGGTPPMGGFAGGKGGNKNEIGLDGTGIGAGGGGRGAHSDSSGKGQRGFIRVTY